MEQKWFKSRPFQSGLKFSGCLVWILLISLVGCSYDGVPVEFTGEWETSAPNYEDCTLSIKPKTVVFKKGTGQSFSFKVDGVKLVLDGWEAHYVLYNQNHDGELYKLPLLIKKTPQGVEIQLTNQRELWWTRKTRSPNEKFDSNRSSSI